MSHLETNIFPITNLEELTSQYRLYQIRGLKKKEYDQNIQHIINKLSYQLQSPVTVIKRDNTPYLVLRDDAPDPPPELDVVRTVALFQSTGETLTLDYKNPTSETMGICIRFLQGELRNLRKDLWQPKPGSPFFSKRDADVDSNIAVYPGFVVRVIATPENGFGFCIDVTQKYVSKKPLPTYLNRDRFERYKRLYTIYHYGHNWFEIRMEELDDLNVTERKYSKDGKMVSLIKGIKEETKKPWPIELANLQDDASDILYKNNRGEDRYAPTALCYLTYDTEDSKVSKLHQRSILQPHIRHKRVHKIVRNYLKDLKNIKISMTPLSAPQKMFLVPDLEFGNNHILSVRRTEGTQHVSLDKLGETRLALLQNSDIGFYVNDPLHRQYFVMPQSIADTMGTCFLEDLKNALDDLYPQDDSYDPIPITYDDRRAKNSLAQGRAILEAVESERREPGYGVVMIHHITDRRKRKQDQLASMVIRKLREQGLHVAIIHTKVVQECYRFDNQSSSFVKKAQIQTRGKLSGYLRNVTLNKILLTNAKWPFVLATPLNADLTIGIDVKQHTAAYTFVGKYGKLIRTEEQTTKQKEKLSEDQIYKMLYDVIKEEVKDIKEYSVENLIVHRDGKLFDCERESIDQVLMDLKHEGILLDSANITFLEIPKSPAASFRLFDVVQKSNSKKSRIDNPQIGFYYILNNTEGYAEGYVCTTGQPFLRQGTAKPLCVRYISGEMPFEKALEDVYLLASLAWTRPEDCSRYPITIKLNDRRLEEVAGEYDEDALRYAKDSFDNGLREDSNAQNLQMSLFGDN